MNETFEQSEQKRAEEFFAKGSICCQYLQNVRRAKHLNRAEQKEQTWVEGGVEGRKWSWTSLGQQQLPH